MSISYNSRSCTAITLMDTCFHYVNNLNDSQCWLSCDPSSFFFICFLIRSLGMVSKTTNVSKLSSEKPHRALFKIVFVMIFSILKHYWRVNLTYKVFPLAPVSLPFFEFCYALIISKSFYLLAYLNVLKPSEMCQSSLVAFMVLTLTYGIFRFYEFFFRTVKYFKMKVKTLFLFS